MGQIRKSRLEDYWTNNRFMQTPFFGKYMSRNRFQEISHNIHLAGSLMLLDGNEIYNSLLLFAPDGRYWRYDKNYPWGWERAYFRDRQGITIAQTDLGDIGMLICWDSAHRDLWAQYAGKVDLMLVSSCPPDSTNPTFHVTNGDQITFRNMGKLLASIEDTAKNISYEKIGLLTFLYAVFLCSVFTTSFNNRKACFPDS